MCIVFEVVKVAQNKEEFGRWYMVSKLTKATDIDNNKLVVNMP